MSNYVLAIDAGTSGARCLIADLNGHVVSLGYKEWAYQSCGNNGSLVREFEPDGLWNTICQCVVEALKGACISTRDLIGVSATSQREGVVFLDKEGRELYIGPNIDLRALTEGISIDSEFGSEVYSITGHKPSFLFVPAKLKWFESNQPETYRKVATVLTISDWIIYRLCGQRVSEVCGASELGLIDIRSRQWSERLRDLLAVPSSIYPELVPAGNPVGKVTAQAAADIGIREGTVVAQGAPDTHCGLIGMGVKDKGQVGIVVGWSAPVQMVTEEPIFDPEARIWTSCYVLDKWLLESSAGEAGNAYRWLKETMLGQEESAKEDDYDLMDRLALKASPGVDGVLAFVGPAAMDMSHLSLKLGGFLFPVPLSVTNIQRAHLVRASLENLCFAIKANCLQLEAISGLRMREVRLGGGLAKSQCLVQALPAVLDMPVGVPEITEVSGLGAAMCAAVGSGAYSGLVEAMAAMVPQTRAIEPDCLAALEYADCYQRWISAGEWLKKLSEAVK